MYVIGFENENDYKKAKGLINTGNINPIIETGDIYEAVVRQEAKWFIDNRLINTPNLYYKEFNLKQLQEDIESSLIESSVIDEIYIKAASIFDKKVEELLEERSNGR